MTKQELRQHYQAKRLSLIENEITQYSQSITDNWRHSLLFNRWEHYHVFLPIKRQNEVNTFLIVDELWKNAKKVYCSKVVGSGLLHYSLRKETPLAINSWGIPEPDCSVKPISAQELEGIECIFIPLLIADKNGHRVGYGKGFYDRFLAELPHSYTIGLSLFPLVERIEDIESHDIPVDAVITPTSVEWMTPL